MTEDKDPPKNGDEAPSAAGDENLPKVGYKNPPVHSRFPPGVSGNPKGRPKGSRSLVDEFSRALAAPITVTENGKTKRVPKQQALVLRVVDKAITKGDRGAIEITTRFAQARDAEASARSNESPAMSAEDKAILEEYFAREFERRNKPAELKARDKDPDPNESGGGS